MFYKFFEPFIFSDLLLREDIGIDALTSLYSAYKMKDELVLLSHLYTHLKLICLNNFALKKLAIKEKLFDVITFIFANGDCGNTIIIWEENTIDIWTVMEGAMADIADGCWESETF